MSIIPPERAFGQARGNAASDDADRIVGLYRRHAKSFARDRNKHLSERVWLDRWAALMPEGGTVLDIGCGSGEPIAHHLIGRGYRLTGVDSAPEMIGLCRRWCPGGQWQVADMRSLSLGRRFQGLIAWDSFFHLRHDDQRRMFPIFGAHAAAGCALMFTSGPAFGEAMGTYQGEALYHASLDPDEYRSLLAENGFSVVCRRIRHAAATRFGWRAGSATCKNDSIFEFRIVLRKVSPMMNRYIGGKKPMLRFALLASAVAIVSYPACSFAQPVAQPTRDVAVQYHVTGSSITGPGQGHVDTIKISYGAAGQRMRIEPVGQPAFMIVDRTAGHMIVVMSGQNMYMDMPYDSHKVLNFSPANAKFTKRGTATVAGLTCTEYDVQSQQHNGSVCLTSDGVMLRAVSEDPQHHGSIEATNVVYGTQPESTFQPPPGYHKMDMAHMGQQGRPAR